MRGPGLDERIAAAYGVAIATGPMLAGAGRADAVLAAVEAIAGLVVEGRGRTGPVGVDAATGVAGRLVAADAADAGPPTWSALPVRASVPMPAVARAAALERMLAWAAAGGADADALEFRIDGDGGCTAHARHAIAAGTRVVTVPRRLMIVDDELTTSSTGAVDPFGPLLRSARDTLAVWLPLEAARVESPWRPFLDVLPAALPDLPSYRSHADLDELVGSEALAIAAAAHEDIGSTYRLLQDEVQARVSLADFAWGRAILRSRGYNVPIDGQARVALIPIVDLLNHRPGDTTWGYHPDEAAYGITTVRAFAAGEEVHATYGAYGNAKLLVGYGFALDDNGVDDAALVFAPADDAVTDLAGHLVWRLPLATPASLAVGPRFDVRLRRALSVARLRAAPFARVRRAAARGLPGRELPWLGVATELDALAELAAAARAGIARLDRPSADAGPPTSWHHACRLVRLGERALLEQVVAFAAAAATHLGAAEPAALRGAADAIAADGSGPQRLLGEYLRAVADELSDQDDDPRHDL